METKTVRLFNTNGLECIMVFVSGPRFTCLKKFMRRRVIEPNRKWTIVE